MSTAAATTPTRLTITVQRARARVPGIDTATETTIQREIAERFLKGQVASADRDDLAQHLRLALLKAIPNYRRRQGAWSTFVRVIIHTTLQGWLRGRLRQCRNERCAQSIFTGDSQGLASWALDIVDHSQSESLEHDDQREAVQVMLTHLDDEDRQIAQLLMEHTPSEVSRLTGRDRSHIYAAMLRMREVCASIGATC